MKWLSIAVAVVFLALAASVPTADAQETDTRVGISPGEVTPTPEMWFYEQNRREYLDPKLAVRRNAEYHAANRQARLAAMKWFGLSNMRPQANSDPFHGDYSARWTSNNFWFPFRWQAVGGQAVFVRGDGSLSRSY